MAQDFKSGLTENEAQKRLEQFGLNKIIIPKEISFWSITKEEIAEPMILLLLVIGFFYTLWGKLEDALTIFVVILLLVFVEVWNEYRAKKAIASLSKISAPKTKVLRDNEIKEINTEEVVPGDILILIPGTRVAADCKISLSYSLQFDESSLTGESFPVEKKVNDEIFAGTLAVAGEGQAEVFATGKETKMGKISELSREIKEPKTALQLAMKDLTKKLVWAALFISALIPLIGILRGQEYKQMVLIGLALAFAIIPEEFPIIITMILGLGSYKLSKQNFLIKKLKAAEVLGDATVIVTDKTGTITENIMKAVSFFPQGQEKEILKAAISATTALSLTPTDKAVISRANELKIGNNFGQIISERNFGGDRKTKSLLREQEGQLMLSISGAPEEVLAICQGEKSQIEMALNQETKNGRRVIAVAQKIISAANKNTPIADLEKHLDFIGLIALEDPPRKGVKETIAQATKAGIRTIMVTGDHPLTAAFIAKSVGINAAKVLTGAELDKLSEEQLKETVKNVNVYARALPEHKYRLVQALHANKEIVAVTGDGVNDALALEAADIGIAMGIKGTDAAKEAADAVLADDNFITISRAIFEGRKFYDNLSKSLKYYLGVKVALISSLLLPVIFNLPLPFAPIQIIILELFMDLAASAGFVAEPAEKNIYTRPPRDPRQKLFNKKLIMTIFIYGFTLFAAVMAAYFYAKSQGYNVIEIQTFAFTAWIIGHIILAYVSRSDKVPLYKLKVFSNKTMNLWLGAVIIFLFLALAIPRINFELKLAPISFSHFILIFIFSLIIIGWLEIRKLFYKPTT
ncbi:MAG: cation-transporting P-type ATPase [Candidatus Parcubacteria bacterium]|nr:cation-transporting P-type ATPase [Candidatus Parcubacteria bacterium]